MRATSAVCRGASLQRRPASPRSPYLREALGLEIEDDPVRSPRLAGEIPDPSGLLDPVANQQAAARWSPWWQLVGPGAALCSIAAAHDPDTIPIILTAVSDS